MTFIAVDAGGTHTRAICVGPDGTLRGAGSAGPGNPTAAGREAADAAIASAINQALAAAGCSGAGVLGAAVCSAGEHAPDRLRVIAAAAGLPDSAAMHLVGDAVAAYLSVADEPAGIALVVGTGSIAARIEGGETTAATDGAGWLLGDAGGGFWLGHRVARAVAADLDGRGEPTNLTRALLAELPPNRSATWGTGRSDAMRAMLGAAYGSQPIALAKFAPLAFAAAGNDPVAAEIVREGSAAVAATLRRARDGGSELPIAGTGSVLLRGYLTPGQPTHALVRELAGSDLRLTSDGLPGAAALALLRAGLAAPASGRSLLAAEVAEGFSAA